MKTSFLTLVMVCFCATLFSQTFVNVNASGANDGSSWADAYTSLSEAIDAASADDELWVAAGTYRAGAPGDEPATTYFLLDKNLSLYGGFAGNETALADREVSANPTILSADLNGDDVPNDFDNNRTDNGYHVLWLDENSEGATVDGFILEGGNARFDNLPMDDDLSDWSAGGMMVLGSATVRQCVFRQNAAAIGAAFLSTGGAMVSLQDCRIENNYSMFGGFGMDSHESAELVGCVFSENTAVELGGAATIGNTNVDILDCTFSDNTSEDDAGGLFIFQNNETLILEPVVNIEGCDFLNNTALFVGGFLMNNFADDSQLNVSDCVFENNTSTEGPAGGFGVRNQVGGTGASDLTATFTDCDIKNNTAIEGGGAAFLSGDFNLVLDMQDCNFIENTGENSGGGLALLTEGNGRLFADLTGVVFQKNTCEVAGAGLYIVNDNDAFRLHATLNDCLFEENTTPGIGGAIMSKASGSGVGEVPGPILTINGSDFMDNTGEACCGAILSDDALLAVSDCHFEGNSTGGDLGGGGAIGLMLNEATTIERSVFLQNTSSEHGGAIYQANANNMVVFDNVLFRDNEGESTVYTEDSLMFRNVSFISNEAGIFTESDDAVIIAQNTIFGNASDNFDSDGDTQVTSLGGNLSNDNSLVDYLNGSGGFDDQHDLDAMLNADLSPAMGSPCVDRGNPDGIPDMATDAAGNPRIQGTSVDIGAYESNFELSSVNDPELAAGVSVFPIPFSTTLNVQAEHPAEAIRLVDMNGKTVQVFSGNESALQITDGVASGQYVVELVFENGTVNKKVVKE